MVYAEVLYQVTSRVERREDIFFDKGDRVARLEVLGHVRERFNWVVYAYWLLSQFSTG
jgi:hypothetical protein